jgi:hypothetical protein
MELAVGFLEIFPHVMRISHGCNMTELRAFDGINECGASEVVALSHVEERVCDVGALMTHRTLDKGTYVVPVHLGSHRSSHHLLVLLCLSRFAVRHFGEDGPTTFLLCKRGLTSWRDTLGLSRGR